MFEFNNNHILTGYIKQLLHDFNLPKFRVYTKEQENYFNTYGVEKDIIETLPADNPSIDNISSSWGIKTSYSDHIRYMPYIRHGHIQEYINGEWYDTGGYIENDVLLRDGKATNIEDILKNKHDTIYNYGSAYLNYTKNLHIKNNTYDSYTHEYLGDYLRFLRDYNNIDLMPLYNCFSNKVCDKLQIKEYNTIYTEVNSDDLNFYKDYLGKYIYTNGQYKLITTSNLYSSGIIVDDLRVTKDHSIMPKTKAYELSQNNQIEANKFIFDTLDTNYKIYMLPVKLFKEYTIAIDSSTGFELCCGIYGDHQDVRDKFKQIPQLTYYKARHANFSQPILYDKVLNLTRYTLKESAAELAQNEDDLKLFIKVPASLNSTIVVLEGDYRYWCDKNGKDKTKSLNYTVTNFEYIDKYADTKFITPLQLLQFNIKKQVPFADRLVEYLMGNSITNMDDIDDNIERAQTVMQLLNPEQNFDFPGVWEDKMRVMAYAYMQNNKFTKDMTINHDLLGYIDKDTEKYYTFTNKRTGQSYTISNIDIYDEPDYNRRLLKYGR